MSGKKSSVNSLIVITGMVFSLLFCLKVRAEERWRIEAESTQVSRNSAVKIVDEIDASSGKVIEIPGDVSTKENLLSLGFPANAIPGRYRIVLRIKAENIYDIGKALRIEVKEGNILRNYAVAYGLYLKGKNGYQDFAIDYDFRSIGQRPVISVRWTTGSESYIPEYGGNPNIRIDVFDFIRSGELPAVVITDVCPDRIRYLVNQDGDVVVTLKNFSLQEQECKIKLSLTHDLEDTKQLGSQIIKLGPEQSKEVKFPLNHGGGLFGYVVRAVLLQNDKIIDEDEEYFCVHNNHFAVATALGCAGRDEEQPGGLFNGQWHQPFSGAGYTDADIKRFTDISRVERDYTTSMEFGRMPGECFYMAPNEPVWIDPQSYLLQSKHEMQKAIAGLKRYGIGCSIYLATFAIGEPVLEIIREKPEWFVYSDATGDHEQWYNIGEAVKHQEFWKSIDWKKFHDVADPEAPTWKGTASEWSKYQEYIRTLSEQARKLGMVGFFVPNFKLPEVVDYVADQIIASAKMFGWDSLRWDVGNLQTGPVFGSYKPFFDFYGKPLHETPEEMEQQVVSNLKRLKARVRKELPNFVFGTNFGSKYETHRYPKLTSELCRDGGWMLDEMSYDYNSPTSPYHFWEKYYDIMTYQGEYITSLGGHYDPYSFGRGGGKYPADRLYETIFRIAGKGHPNTMHYNSRTPAGNFAQFCVRFSRFIWDTNLRRVNNPEEIITVEPENLWWNKSVQRLKLDKKEFLIVHLINPPVKQEIEVDPTNRLPEPVNNTTVTVKIPSGKSKVSAWILTAESWKLGESPKTQAVSAEVKIENNQATILVPQVLYWKVAVFQFE